MHTPKHIFYENCPNNWTHSMPGAVGTCGVLGSLGRCWFTWLYFLPGWLVVPVYSNTVFRFLQLAFVLILFRIFKIAMVMGIVVCRQIYQTKGIQNWFHMNKVEILVVTIKRQDADFHSVKSCRTCSFTHSAILYKPCALHCWATGVSDDMYAYKCDGDKMSSDFIKSEGSLNRSQLHYASPLSGSV